MTKKPEQRVLHFPTSFPLEPGNRGDEDAAAAPVWKQEVARRVREHRNMKDHQHNMDGLRQLENGPAVRSPVDPEEDAAPPPPMEPDPPVAVSRAHLSDPPPTVTPPPLPPAAPPAAGQPVPSPDLPAGRDVFERLARTHQRLFDPPDPPPQPGRPFDEIPLDKAELPTPARPARRPQGDPPPPRRPRVERALLVSRLLAGLLDFLFNLGLAAILVLLTAASFGLDPISPRMGWLLGLTYLLSSLVTSFYFLFLCGRTPGMLIVGLRLVDTCDNRPPPRAILIRWLTFLLSLLCGGLGLWWSLFDREARCWHDWLSDTRVERVP